MILQQNKSEYFIIYERKNYIRYYFSNKIQCWFVLKIEIVYTRWTLLTGL